MIRNEAFRDGLCVEAEIIDLDAGTIAHEENGVVVSTRALTDDERATYTPAPDVRAELLAQLDATPLMLDELRDALVAALTEGLI